MAVYLHQIDGKRIRSRLGESDQVITVEFLIGKCDQTLTSTAVMPFEHSNSPKGFLTSFENGLIINVFEIIIFIGRLRLVTAGKEIGRRKLFLIAHDNHLFGSQKTSKRILRPHLRGFVDDEKIKAQSCRRKKFGK